MGYHEVIAIKATSKMRILTKCFLYQLKDLPIILGRRPVFDDRHSPGGCSGRQSLSAFVQNVSPVRRKSLHKVRIEILHLSTQTSQRQLVCS